MIESIAMTNFRKHEDLTVRFGPGLTSITGPNSAGKSTVLKAILYALFGPTGPGIPKDRLWTRGTGTQGCVTVRFSDGTEVIRSDRSAKVVKDGEPKPVASGHTPVNKWVEDLFGMAQNDIITLMYSPQGGTRQLLEMGGTGLQAKVESLSGLTVVDSVLGMVREDLMRAEVSLSALGGMPDLDGLQRELDEKRLRLEGLMQILNARVTTVEAAVKAREEAQTAWQSAVGQQQRREVAESVAGQEEARLAKAQQALRDAEECLLQYAGLGEVDTSALDAKRGKARLALDEGLTQAAAIDALRKQKADAEKWAEQNKGALARHEASLPLIEKAEAWLKNAEEVHAECVKAFGQASLEADKAEAILHSAACPECKRPYEGFDVEKATKEFNAKSRAKFEARQAAHEAGDVERNAREALRKAKAYYDPPLKMYWDQCRASIESMDKSLSGLHYPDVDRLKGECMSIEDELNKAVLLQERRALAESAVLKAMNDLKEAERGLREARDYLASVGVPSPTVDEAAKLLDAAQAHEETAREARSVAGDEARQASHDVGLLELALQAAEERADRIREAQAKADSLAALQKYLRGSRSRLSAEVWEGLLDYATSLAMQAAPDPMGRLSRTEKGEFMAGDVPVSDFGGAMQSVVGLALRLAMARVFFGHGLPQLLDECQEAASDETAAAMAGMLLGLGSQVISVTHREGDAAMGEIIHLGG